MFDWRILLAGGALLAAFLAGSFVNGQRWESKYTALELEHSRKEVTRNALNTAALVENQAWMVDAVQLFQQRTAENEKAYANLTTSLSNLSRTVGGLRGDFSGLPGFIRDANSDTLGRYTAACTDVFGRMAERSRGLGATGARIARAADGHYANEALAK